MCLFILRLTSYCFDQGQSKIVRQKRLSNCCLLGNFTVVEKLMRDPDLGIIAEGILGVTTK